jgi:cation diffusion facilitator family transporter
VADSRRAIYAAIAANFAIAVTKFIAAAVTGSSAMFAEGLHSVVDTADGALLLLGHRRSARPADAAHPFGHGQELYFWTLIVALLIFAVGGGVSLFQGVQHVRHPEPPVSVYWDYVVLGAAAVFETVSFVVGVRQFRAEYRGRGFWRSLHDSKDPSIFTVVFEDTADLIGILIAFLGLFLGQLLRLPVLDGVASILIGVLLMGVSILLARESKGLLVGEGVDPATAGEICRLAQADPAVAGAARPLTMHFGPRTVLLAMDIEFQPSLTAGELTAAIDRIEAAIRGRFPEIRHIFIESHALSRTARRAA